MRWNAETLLRRCRIQREPWRPSATGGTAAGEEERDAIVDQLHEVAIAGGNVDRPWEDVGEIGDDVVRLCVAGTDHRNAQMRKQLPEHGHLGSQCVGDVLGTSV
jgi:hypothetical protein